MQLKPKTDGIVEGGGGASLQNWRRILTRKKRTRRQNDDKMGDICAIMGSRGCWSDATAVPSSASLSLSPREHRREPGENEREGVKDC